MGHVSRICWMREVVPGRPSRTYLGGLKISAFQIIGLAVGTFVCRYLDTITYRTREYRNGDF